MLLVPSPQPLGVAFVKNPFPWSESPNMYSERCKQKNKKTKNKTKQKKKRRPQWVPNMPTPSSLEASGVVLTFFRGVVGGGNRVFELVIDHEGG